MDYLVIGYSQPWQIVARPLFRMFAAAAARAKAALVFIHPCFSDYQRETSSVGHVLLIQTE